MNGPLAFLDGENVLCNYPQTRKELKSWRKGEQIRMRKLKAPSTKRPQGRPHPWMGTWVCSPILLFHCFFFVCVFCFVPANVVLKRAVLWDLWLKKPDLSSTLRSHKVLRTGVIGSSIEVFILFIFFKQRARLTCLARFANNVLRGIDLRGLGLTVN